MRVVRLMDEPDWQSRLSPIEEIFFATSPSAKTLRPDKRQPFKERWPGRYIAYDIENFFVAITEISTVAGYLAGRLDNPAHNPRFVDNGYYASFAPLCDRYPAICTSISTNATVIAVLAPRRCRAPPPTRRRTTRTTPTAATFIQG
jgi:hypothetical protein